MALVFLPITIKTMVIKQKLPIYFYFARSLIVKMYLKLLRLQSSASIFTPKFPQCFRNSF